METATASADTAPPATRLVQRISPQFSGKGGEYSRIYFANIILSILTIGIYSAWAKVRNRRYFYGHTTVEKSRFDFDANPKTILISRIIIVGVILAFFLIENLLGISIFGVSVGVFLFVLLLPFFMVRSRAFNFRHTLWRGVRFAYARRYRQAYAHLCVILVPQLAVIWLIIFADSGEDPAAAPDILEQLSDAQLAGVAVLFLYVVLLFPIGLWWRHRIIANQLSFGNIDFVFATKLRQYVASYAIHMGIMLAFFALLAWLGLDTETPSEGLDVTIGYAMVLIGVSFYAHAAKLFWNGLATTEGSTLSAQFAPLGYLFKIVVVNFILRIVSIGLLIPYTRVREWRYLAQHITLHPSTSLSGIVAQTDASFQTAIAAESIDFEGGDIDVGFI